MPTPDFVLKLREKVGTAPLWLSGVLSVILDETGEHLLLMRRSDTGEWTPPGGIVEPGEQPAVTAIREALEETGVVVEIVRLGSVGVTPLRTYANGDQAQYLDLDFLCRWVSGDPHPADDEALEVRWFPLDALPPIPEEYLRRVERVLGGGEAARFSIAADSDSW